jgi:cell division protease FtsH
MFLPEEDRYLTNRSKFEDDLTAALGGRAAEEVVFNDVTTGAKTDLEWTTRVARAMVTQYGMSDKLGPLTFGEKNELVFLGREIGEQRNYSEAVAQEIDAEVKRIITQAYNRARQIIVERREKLEAVARRLLEKETIDRAEFEAIMA